MANPMNTAIDQGKLAMEKTKEAAQQFGDKAKEAGQQVSQKAKDAAGTVGDMATSAASSVGKTAEKLTAAAGHGVKQLGDTIEEKGPQEGVLGGATRAVASSLRESGRYIEQEGLSGMADDVTTLIRRNPVPSVLVAVGIGFLIGRTLGSS